MATKADEPCGTNMNLDKTAKLTLQLSNLEHTTRLASLFAELAQPGQFVALCGDLGAGKTTFTRQLTEYLGSDKLATSPTFALFQHYPGGRLPVFHADLYRIGSDDELFDLGWDEHLFDYESGLVVVEWADKFPDAWPADHLEVRAGYGEGDEERWLKINAQGSRSQVLLAALEEKWKLS